MNKLILVALATLSLNALALKLDSGNNKKIYLSADGKQVDAITAFKDAIDGKEMLECHPVEAVGNQRTGKVTLKASK